MNTWLNCFGYSDGDRDGPNRWIWQRRTEAAIDCKFYYCIQYSWCCVSEGLDFAGQAVREIIVAPGDPIDNYLNDVGGQVTWTLQCQWFPERGVCHVHQLSRVKSDEGEQFWAICSKELMVAARNTAYFAPEIYAIYCCIPPT